MESTKGDNPPTYGKVTRPDAVRAHSPMRMYPTEAPTDLEAQNDPAMTDATENRTRSWRDCYPKYWWPKLQSCGQKAGNQFMEAFCPCCLGRHPHMRITAYHLFPCCTGPYERRNHNLGMCLGLLFAALLVIVAFGFLSILIYLILNACNKI